MRFSPFLISFIITIILFNVLYKDSHSESIILNSQNAKIITVPAQNMQWNYGGYRFTVSMQLDTGIYSYYKRQSKNQPYTAFATEFKNQSYLQNVAKILKEDADDLGYRGKQLVDYLTAFVQQNIVYTKDPYNGGYDYPKYPIETLYEKKGDCEDSAILLVSLLKVFGFDAVLIQLPSHMAVGVVCTNWGTSYYKFENKRYAYIETTNPKWAVGQIPDEYKKTSAQLIKTPALAEVSTDKTIEKPLVTKYDASRNDSARSITVNGESYTVKPNQNYVIRQNGLVISISHQ